MTKPIYIFVSETAKNDKQDGSLEFPFLTINKALSCRQIGKKPNFISKCIKGKHLKCFRSRLRSFKIMKVVKLLSNNFTLENFSLKCTYSEGLNND